MPPNHHTGRPWLRRRLAVLDRDRYRCSTPICTAAEWLANPPPRDRHLAAEARAWAATQSTPRAIWRTAPRYGERLHPLSASVDMVHPKSHGGDDTDMGNLRAAHLLCNVSRGAGGYSRSRYGVSAPRVAAS